MRASLLVTENEQIHDGIVTLVKVYGITKLVMGSTPDKYVLLHFSSFTYQHNTQHSSHLGTAAISTVAVVC